MGVAIWTYAPALIGAVIALGLDGFAARRSAVAVAAAGLFMTAAVSLLEVNAKQVAAWGALRVGGWHSAVAALIAGIAGVVLLGGWSELTRREWGGSLAALVAIGAAASIAVAQADELIWLLVALETAGACGYALVALGGRSGSREAAIKYFIQGTIATALLILGTAVLVAVFVPNGAISALTDALSVDPTLREVALGGLVLVVAGLAFKAGAVPFHSWVPDAYENAAPNTAAFLATGPKIAAVAALAACAGFASTQTLGISVEAVLVLLGVVSVLVGSITALRQRSYTRMLGYAGVAQVGYALIAAGLFGSPQIAVFFIAMYAIASAGTFLAATAFSAARPSWDGTIDGLAGLGRQAPMLGIATSVLVISLAGIPPLVGFWSKFAVFVAAGDAAVSAFVAGNPLEGWIALGGATAGIIGSVVSLAYYGGVLRALYAPLPEPSGTPAQPDAEDVSAADVSGRSALAAVLVLALVVVALGLIPLGSGIDSLMRVFA